MHSIPIVLELGGKELSFLNPWHKDVVTFPQVETQNMFIRNPFQPAFGGIDQLAGEIHRRKDKDIPVVAFELREQEQAAQFWIPDR